MLDILDKYDVLGAFWMTIKLTFFSAIGALVLGTILAVMRVAPVAILRRLGAFYVNTVRNTPLTLILLFCVLGVLYVLQIPLAPTDSPTSVRDISPSSTASADLTMLLCPPAQLLPTLSMTRSLTSGLVRQT